MMHHPVNLQTPSVTPLQDTWQFNPYLGSWMVAIPYDCASHTTQEVNNTVAELFQGFLSDFGEWQRIRKLKISREEELRWDFEIPYSEFIQLTVQKIQTCPGKIHTLTAELDMFIYTRTEQLPDQIIRGWISNYTELRIGDAFGEIFSSFQVYCSIFCYQSPELDNNEELYNLNHPILSASLHAWEKRFGEIDADDGFFGLYPHGFLP